MSRRSFEQVWEYLEDTFGELPPAKTGIEPKDWPLNSYEARSLEADLQLMANSNALYQNFLSTTPEEQQNLDPKSNKKLSFNMEHTAERLSAVFRGIAIITGAIGDNGPFFGLRRRGEGATTDAIGFIKLGAKELFEGDIDNFLWQFVNQYINLSRADQQLFAIAMSSYGDNRAQEAGVLLQEHDGNTTLLDRNLAEWAALGLNCKIQTMAERKKDRGDDVGQVAAR